MHNFTPLVINGKDKNKQLTLLTQRKLAFTGRHTICKWLCKFGRTSKNLVRHVSIYWCHRKPNTARETVPLIDDDETSTQNMLSSSLYLHLRERVTYGLHALTVSGGVVMLYVHAPSQVMRVMPFDSLSPQLYEVHDASDAASPPSPFWSCSLLMQWLRSAVTHVQENGDSYSVRHCGEGLAK